MTTIVEPMNDDIPASLVDESVPPEEVNDEIGFSFIQGNDEIDEVENDEGDEEREWDDGNETDEAKKNLHLYDDDDDDIDEDEDADDCVVMNSYVLEYSACQTIGCDFTYII